MNGSRQLPKVYIEEFKRVASLAFSMWNRDPGSPSFGSFDRQYWGWKFRDMSDATLQYAVKLCVEYSAMMGWDSVLAPLLEGYVAYCRRIQLRDGSFDQCYPNERTPGVVYDILSTLIYVRRSPYLTSSGAQADLDGIIARAAVFALRTDEVHGEIANHLAEYAYELFCFAEYAEDEKAKQKGEAYLERLLFLFDRNEGWFREYDGPDPGYQTRTLRYLAKCAVLLDRTELWDVAHRAAGFIEAVLMPDGSIHPMLGARSTALLYPSGIELLAVRDRRHEGLAARVREAWSHGRVPLPSWLDFANAIRLADDAFDAWRIVSEQENEVKRETECCNKDESETSFANAGISVFRSRDRFVYIGYRLGGVVVIYERKNNDEWVLQYEDSGYLLRVPGSDKRWLTRMPNSGILVECSANRLLIKSVFCRSLHEDLTPWRFLVLRMLNLTVLRFQWFGDFFRKKIVGRLVNSRREIPVVLLREISVLRDRVSISDIVGDHRGISNKMRGELFRCRRLTGTHMASSRYFQEQELQETALDWIQAVRWSGPSEAVHTIEIMTDTGGEEQDNHDG